MRAFRLAAGVFLGEISKWQHTLHQALSGKSLADPTFRQLREQGIVRGPDVTGLSELLLRDYDASLLGVPIKTEFLPIFDKKDDRVFLGISLSSPILYSHVFTAQLKTLITSYLGNKFYLRNNPQFLINVESEKEWGSEKFHIDGMTNALNVMINLTDVDAQSTHMEYLIGSHKKHYYFKSPRHQPNINAKHALGNDVSVYSTFGPKDSSFIFNAGNGFHRKVVGSNRRVCLILTFINNKADTYFNRSRGGSQNDQAFWHSPITNETKKLISESPFSLEAFSLVLK